MERQIEIPPSLELPGDVSGEELGSFLDDLIRRLRYLAAPEDFLERARGG